MLREFSLSTAHNNWTDVTDRARETLCESGIKDGLCVVYCPHTTVYRVKKTEATTGRYVATDYNKCIGCHICADVCPTGYIEMGLGE